MTKTKRIILAFAIAVIVALIAWLLGGLLINVIQRQDNTMVQALVLIFASLGIIGLFLGDLLMIIVDPRISLNRGEASR